MSDVCLGCGNEYEIIGSHWSRSSSCEFPSFTQHQSEMAVGILMGDGTINMCNKNPSLEVQMTSPNYLEHLASEFGILGGEVSLHRTAEENAKLKRDSGFRPNADADNYSDIYINGVR